MKVNEFIDNYLKVEKKDEYIMKHMTNNYVPYLNKVSECKQILDSTCYTNTEPKMFLRNRANQNMLFICRMISLYTDIKLSFGDKTLVEEFDMLNKVGALDMIISNIYEKEYSEFECIMDMCVADLYDNERNYYSIVDTIKVLSNTILSSIDFNSINSFLENNINNN